MSIHASTRKFGCIGLLTFALWVSNDTAATYEYGLSSILGSGSIELDALSGSNSTDGLVDFSFTTSWFDPDFTFDESMVEGVQWSIDHTTLALSLDLDMLTKKAGGLDRDLSIDTLGWSFDALAVCSGALGPGGNWKIQICGSQGLGTIHAQNDDLTATLVVSPVPEPTSLALLGLGLAALTVFRGARANPPKRTMYRTPCRATNRGGCFWPPGRFSDAADNPPPTQASPPPSTSPHRAPAYPAGIVADDPAQPEARRIR